MKRPEFFRSDDDNRLEPEIERELAAVDAVLAGQSVHPDYDEIAALAVAVRDEAPDVDAEFAAMLDERAAAGFPRRDARAGAGTAATKAGDWLGSLRVRRLVPVLGAVTSLLVVIGVSVSVLNSGNDGVGSSSSSVTSAQPNAGAGSSGGSASVTSTTAIEDLSAPAAERAAKSTELFSKPLAASPPAADSVAGTAPAGRHIAQKASLTLSTDPEKVRGIASEVTTIVARHHGLVISSQITSGHTPPDGGPGQPVPLPEPLPFATGALGAEFQLRIPANQVDAALDELSQLGLVVSREQGTQDITGSFHAVHSRIQDLRSERDKLLAELPTAVSQEAIDAINARLKVIQAQLSGSENQLGHLKQRVAVVPVHVSVVAKGEGGDEDSSFDLGQAAHDAGRVLVVGAGVALISLAVIVPLGLLAALVWVSTSRVRRRRRERALD